MRQHGRHSRSVLGGPLCVQLQRLVDRQHPLKAIICAGWVGTFAELLARDWSFSAAADAELAAGSVLCDLDLREKKPAMSALKR